ncbi:MAG TPA: Rieske (2Fe-2S) protein [Ktedonobacterales bacterium]|nr:Rieske (2Fe-2S) protein [Ktedonobacterales bacterium]
MSELESAQQYMRAHELIERLRAERRPDRADGSDEDARLSATAALLHAAAPDGASVAPDFAARLFARLEAEQARMSTEVPHEDSVAEAQHQVATAMTSPAEPHARSGRAGVSRRGVVLGGLGAAAAALAGAAVSSALERPTQGTTTGGAPPGALVPAGTGAWVAVAALNAMPLGAVKRFEAGAVIGYLQNTASGFVALSGVCTHMACLLQWNSGAGTFDCPCHGGRFLQSGQPAPGARYQYAPLPAIETKVEGEQVWVYVAGSATVEQYPPADATSTTHGYGPTQSGK